MIAPAWPFFMASGFIIVNVWLLIHILFLRRKCIGKLGVKNEIVFMETDFRANPFVFTFAVRFDSLAQLVEQQTLNLWAQGSIP